MTFAHALLLATAVEPPALATTDAVLNGIATVLLVSGFLLIKSGREQAHKWAMLAALGVSTAFLICYLTYHLTSEPVRFGGSGAIRPVYFSILISHVALAVTVPGAGDLDGRTRPEGPPSRASQAGVVDVSDLALCLDHRRDRVFDALPSLPAHVMKSYNPVV